MLNEKLEIEIIQDFYSKTLDNKRKLRIYLPPSYAEQITKYYPVLYVHDGQNVFHGEESYSGESWDLHKTTDYMIKEDLIEEIIIVAIDNMKEERLREYAHQDGFYKGDRVKARGFQYEKFLIRELMPFIEQSYRIKKGPENTAMMGSSMGGLVTFNIGLRRRDLFSKLAVMSPSFWWGKTSPLRKINSYQYSKLDSKIWIDTGEAEGRFMSFNEKLISRFKELKSNYNLDLIYYQVPGAIHSETAWAARVYCPLLYFYGDIGEVSDIELTGAETINLQNPANSSNNSFGGSNNCSNNNLNIRINPIVTFDSQFKMSALAGEFKSLNPEVLKVNINGIIIPQKIGSARVEFNAYEHQAFKEIEVRRV